MCSCHHNPKKEKLRANYFVIYCMTLRFARRMFVILFGTRLLLSLHVENFDLIREFASNRFEEVSSDLIREYLLFRSSKTKRRNVFFPTGCLFQIYIYQVNAFEICHSFYVSVFFLIFFQILCVMVCSHFLDSDCSKRLKKKCKNEDKDLNPML